jgi:antitoxin CptB
MDDVRLKRLRFRAWHRGFREADLILGPFADSHAQHLEPDQLDMFERLLEQHDHDIYDWIAGRAQPPRDFAELILLLQAFKPSQRKGDHGA